jgi:hypothetical protein
MSTLSLSINNTIGVLVFKAPALLLEVQLPKVRKECSVHVNISQVFVVDRVGGGEWVESIVTG